jgi:Peptidase family S41
MHKQIAFFLIIFGLATALSAQNDPAAKLPAKVAKADLIKDVQNCMNALIGSHPDPFKYNDSLAFLAENQRIMRQINLLSGDSIPNGQAYIYISNMVAMVRCGHTYPIGSLKKTDFTLPKAATTSLGDQFVVFDIKTADSIYNAAELLSINGVPLTEIRKQIGVPHAGDGLSPSFDVRSCAMKIFSYYQAFYGGTDTWSLGLKSLKGEMVTIVLPGEKIFKSKEELKAEKAATKDKPKETKTDSTKTVKPRDITLVKSKDAAKLFKLGLDTSVYVMDVNTFSFGKYKKFYRKSFKAIRKAQPKVLVIDLRNNTGGAVSNVMFLTGYLDTTVVTWDYTRNRKFVSEYNTNWVIKNWLYGKPGMSITGKKIGKTLRGDVDFKPHKKKKQYQPEQLYVLTNPLTFSGGSVTASILKQNSNATVVGMESGGGAYQFNALVSQNVKLPHSGIKFLIPVYHVDMLLSTVPDKGRGVIPDYTTYPTQQQLYNDDDAYMIRVIELAKKH